MLLSKSPWTTSKLFASVFKYNKNHLPAGSPGGKGGQFAPTEFKEVWKPTGDYFSVNTALTKLLSDSAQKVYDSLTPEEKRSLSDYTYSMYRPINRLLAGRELGNMPIRDEAARFDLRTEEGRVGLRKHIEGQIANLDRVLDKSTIPENILVNRGVAAVNIASMLGVGRLPDKMRLDNPDVESLLRDLKGTVGKVYTEKVFSSTSVRKAFGTYANAADEKGTYHLEIEVPKGSKGMYIARYSFTQGEEEVLLPRNSKFQVMNVSMVRSNSGKSVVPVIRVRLLGQETVTKYNKNHEPAGSPKGGQFASGPDRISKLILNSGAGSDYVHSLYAKDPLDAIATDFDLNTVRMPEIEKAREYIKRISQERLRREFGEEITAYRGLKGTEGKGEMVSLTLSKSTAKFHAEQQGKKTGTVVEMKVKVSDVLSYSDALGMGTFDEKEVIIPHSVFAKHSVVTKYNPHHEPAGSPKGGQFAKSPTSLRISGGNGLSDLGDEVGGGSGLKAGDSFLVLRIGGKDMPLDNRNGGNTESVFDLYARYLEDDSPVETLGTHLNVYRVTLTKDTGEYSRFNKGEASGLVGQEVPKTDVVGRNVYGSTKETSYSFPSGGAFTQERLLSVEIGTEFKSITYGPKYIREELKKLLQERVIKYNPNHEPAGSPKGGQFAKSPSGPEETFVEDFIQPISGHIKPEYRGDINLSFEETRSKLSLNETDALWQYTKEGYSGVNKYLNGRASADAIAVDHPDFHFTNKEMVGLLDSALDKSSLPLNMVLRRGTAKINFFDSFPELRGKFNQDKSFFYSEENLSILTSLIGKTYTEKNFVSTSLANEFMFWTARSDSRLGVINVEIEAPKGKKGLYVANLASNFSEQEVVLPRNSQFQIRSIKVEKTYDNFGVEVFLPTIRVRYLGQDTTKKFDHIFKFNPYHEPAGSPKGGQFAPKPGKPVPGSYHSLKPKHFLHISQIEPALRSSVIRSRISEYSDLGSIGVNHLLRFGAKKGILGGVLGPEAIAEGEVKDTATIIEVMDYAFLNRRHHTTTGPKPTVVWRGVSSEEVRKILDSVSIGDVVGDKAFISSSASRETAFGFARRNLSGAEKRTASVVVKINLPPHTKYLVGSVSEQEFILNRGSLFRIKSKKKIIDGMLEVELDMLPETSKKSEVLWIALSPPYTEGEVVQKYNPNHEPAGSPIGGQFAKSPVAGQDNRNYKKLLGPGSVGVDVFDSFAAAGKKQVEELSKDETQSLTRYVDNYFKVINRNLAGRFILPEQAALEGNPPDFMQTVKNHIKNITSALDKASLPDDVLLFRGMPSTHLYKDFGIEAKETSGASEETIQYIKDTMVGMVYEEKAFASTSLGDVNLTYASSGHESGVVQLRIKAKKGSKGLYLANTIAQHIGHGREQEVLLQRNSKFMITDVHPHPDFKRLVVVEATLL